jgi:hypothetical protein
VPRTASSSIEKALINYHDELYDKTCKLPSKRSRKSLRLSHITTREFEPMNKSIWKEKIKFAFVRNPYDRIVSYFYYYKLWKKMSFKSFIKTYILEGKKLSVSYWCDQHYWLANKKGRIIIDHIGKFESLNKDLKKICNIIDIPVPTLPWLKKSKDRNPYKTYYDKKTAKMVRDRCIRDFELFDYKLDL